MSTQRKTPTLAPVDAATNPAPAPAVDAAAVGAAVGAAVTAAIKAAQGGADIAAVMAVMTGADGVRHGAGVGAVIADAAADWVETQLAAAAAWVQTSPARRRAVTGALTALPLTDGVLGAAAAAAPKEGAEAVAFRAVCEAGIAGTATSTAVAVASSKLASVTGLDYLAMEVARSGLREIIEAAAASAPAAV